MSAQEGIGLGDVVVRISIFYVAGLLLFIGGIYVYSSYDRGFNYEQTTARVLSVEPVCYLTKPEYRVGMKMTRAIEVPCEAYRKATERSPELGDYKFLETATVRYEYRSPADGKWHKGEHEQAKHRDGRKIEFGDELVVLAHKTEPEKTQYHW